jgi:hypothetical protein
VAEVVTPALARLEAEIAAVLDERRDEIVGQLARILVAMAVEARHGERSRNGRPLGPKRCTVCGGLAAPARTICHSCRGRIRRERERLRQAKNGELEAARNGARGPRAQELATGDRLHPAQALVTTS